MEYIKVQKTVFIKDQTEFIIEECTKLRISKKESVVDLSNYLGIDRRKIYNFEKGKFNLKLAEAILNFYDLTLKISIQ